MKKYLKVTGAIIAKQQNSLTSHTLSCDCTQLKMSLHQWWQQLCGELFLLLWDDVRYK